MGSLIGETQRLGYMSDMPAIMSTTTHKKVDNRNVAVLGTSRQLCNVFIVGNDAPRFEDGREAVKWMDGKNTAVPKGVCTDRFGHWAFRQANVKPKRYLNQGYRIWTE